MDFFVEVGVAKSWGLWGLARVRRGVERQMADFRA